MNLLITGAWPNAKEHLDELKAMGHSVAFLQQEKDEPPCDPAWVEGVVCNGLFLYHPICSFPNLRYIQLTSAGFDRVDIEYVQAHSIEIHNAKGVYSIPMAEFAVSAVLDLYKEWESFRDQQRKREWRKRRGLRELAGKRVVIVGCGDVGAECAKRFSAFDCEVIGVNRTVRNDAPFFERIVGLKQLEEELPAADIVIVSIALSDGTRGLVHTRSMKTDAVLVNISRGPVVVCDGSCTAVLDVFAQEPLEEESALWDADNVVVTPHNSFVGDNNARRLWGVIRDNLARNTN